ncbi:duf1857 domain-containing protein [Fusarium albosuccineum]|uniref:Duf1857 domain-containing protein n=1 Tax=Fusarium albosuccineum TaxID=1237068 RepID=A0A8H4PCH1_9HYPO|nr:duf1857 domain-containing protein [Fusarium albosuccineum]
MVNFNLAYTAPINPAGAEPVLTRDQVWKGLKRKVRHAQEFVSVIVDCKVITEEVAETGDKVTREVTFVPNLGIRDSNAPAKETVYEFAPSRVDFHQEDGSTVSNIVSSGPDGELLMTYAFEWRHPSIAEGSDEAKALEAKNWKLAPVAVEGSIDTIRRLVKEGEIQ